MRALGNILQLGLKELRSLYRDPALVAHYGGAELAGGTVLLVTATEVRAVGDEAQAAGALDRAARVVGHDGSGGLGAGEALDLGAVIRRQVVGHAGR